MLAGQHDARHGPLSHRVIQPSEFPAAARLLAVGMRDNPLHVAVFGSNSELRRRALQRMFTGLLEVGDRSLIGAFSDQRLIGVMGSAAPGSCRVRLVSMLQIGGAILPAGPATLARMALWQRAWQARDPAQPHEHFGPFAVDPRRRGQGVGSYLLNAHVTTVDARGWTSYLETDKWANVELYRRYGYQIEGEASVLNVFNWFLRRHRR